MIRELYALAVLRQFVTLPSISLPAKTIGHKEQNLFSIDEKNKALESPRRTQQTAGGTPTSFSTNIIITKRGLR